MRRFLLTALLLMSCAKAPPGSQSTVLVGVRNDLIPPSNVSVYLVPRGGIERMLGTVVSGRQVLRYTGLAPVGDHYLVARLTNGRQITSNVLVMDRVTALEWTLSSNLVRVVGTQNDAR